MSLDQKVNSGNRAKHILESEEWKEAWTAYRNRILQLIEDADSRDAELVANLKRHLTAAKAARQHLELLMGDGRMAVEEIEFQKKQRLIDRIRPSWA